MIDSMLGGLGLLFFGWTPLFLLAGCALGLVVGVLPALGATAGMSLLLPFIFGLDQASALALMIGMLATVATGDTVTSIVLGVPGSASSQATILDGFPLAKRGEAGRALSAAYFASMLGGLFGAAVLTATLLVARQIILYFGMPEMLMLVLFGLASVAALSGASLGKGMAACCLGLLVGAVGAAPATGEYRLDFGVYHFGDGFSLIACVLGVFVIPEIVDLLRSGKTISEQPLLKGGGRQGIRDVLNNKGLVLRTSGLGCLIGALPGIGGSVVDWLAYGHAVRSAKDKSQFGKGDIRGVIAVEGSNNAVLGGALLPTLLFAVPGSGSTALFLSGLILVGIQPGPAMVQGNLSLTFSIVWSLALANVIGAVACYFMSGTFAKLTRVPFVWLAPILLLVVCFAVLQSGRAPLDLVVLGGFGVLGLFLRRFGYARPAFLIGFVLQDNLEVLLYQSAQIYTFETFFTRPIVLIVGAIILATLTRSLLTTHKLDTESSGSDIAPLSTAQFGVPAFMLVVFGGAAVMLTSFTPLGRMFPMAVAAIGSLCALTVIAGLVRRKPNVLTDQETDQDGKSSGPLRPMLWILGGLAMIWGMGFFIGGPMALAAFLAVEAKTRPVTAIAAALITAAVFWGLSQVAGLNMPAGILTEFATR
ncbi:tripartite tricarboxylate transporter permease (plasmid) [Paracoccus liaowanqingii]|uniref:Tripartite tricarboxylate transporter permease n=1 Tax=Paracoccus liaowanqingii TaxID=2560053 RepID=A0A4Y5STY4_9RHOB|nr:tripartite tricarboxylate transporter permease [Paracoccus liaowanqingii]QDA36184.1 tripartite tricarboxylate transporter permease [Paracoccus liaowanqingii]